MTVMRSSSPCSRLGRWLRGQGIQPEEPQILGQAEFEDWAPLEGLRLLPCKQPDQGIGWNPWSDQWVGWGKGGHTSGMRQRRPQHRALAQELPVWPEGWYPAVAWAWVPNLNANK